MQIAFRPGVLARTAGVLYVLEGVTSMLGHIVIPGRFLVASDAGATAANILAHPTLFRVGGALGLVAVAFLTAQTVLLYLLIKPVGRTVALLFAFFSLTAVASQVAASLFQLPALAVLQGAASSSAIGADQSAAWALLTLRVRAQVFNQGFLFFFGIRSAVLGYAIYKSTFLPRPIGILMVVAGVSFATNLWPSLTGVLGSLPLVLAAPGELAFVLWLLVVGVNVEAWHTTVAAARPTPITE